MKNFVQKGNVITIIAVAIIAAGEMVKFGTQVGVAVTDAAIGEEVALELGGVFELPKGAEAITQGTAVYFIAGTKLITATAAGNTLAGFAWNTTIAGDATQQVKLPF